MSFTHIPVLLHECLEQTDSMVIPLQKYLDLTLGRGGHAAAFLTKHEQLFCVGVDQDLQAIQETKDKFLKLGLNNRCQFVHGSFHDWKKQSEKNQLQEKYDLILMDLGVSSPQLDNQDRGFSFYKDGPLDMRMNQSQSLSAATIINEFDEESLNQIFKDLGEIYNPYRVTNEILIQRKIQPFNSTLRLSQLIEAKEGWRKKGSHPATKYFLALRMAVNNEIDGLKKSLPEIMEFLNPGGRLLVITFHSLEDRIVKFIFKNSSIGFPVTKKVIKPQKDEIEQNQRSRSAQLRVFESQTLDDHQGIEFKFVDGVKNAKRNKYR